MGRTWWVGAWLFLVLLFFLAARIRERELFLGEFRRAELVLVHREQVSDDAVVQLEGALVLRQRGRFRAEARDDVVALFLAPDGVRQLTPAPVIDAHVGGGAEQGVDALAALSDGGVLESRLEDIARLVLPKHGEPSLWSFRPASLPSRGG